MPGRGEFAHDFRLGKVSVENLEVGHVLFDKVHIGIDCFFNF